MHDAQLLERLALADEYPPAGPLPEDIWTVDAISDEVERRTGMTHTADHKAPETERPPGRTRRVLAAAAAFAAVILLGVAIWATTARQTGGELIDAPPTTAVVPTTEAAQANPETEAADVAFIERFVDTWFESADPLAAMAMIGETGDGPEGDEAHGSEITYQAAIEADVSVTDCVPVDGQRVYGCKVSYSNMLFEVISDGRMAPMADTAIPVTTASLRRGCASKRRQVLPLRACASCTDHIPVAYPALQREHLDTFAAWWVVNRG